jgi:hypothetical protein
LKTQVLMFRPSQLVLLDVQLPYPVPTPKILQSTSLPLLPLFPHKKTNPGAWYFGVQVTVLLCVVRHICIAMNSNKTIDFIKEEDFKMNLCKSTRLAGN